MTSISTVVEFDVTNEIEGLLAGTIDHRGWVVAFEDSATASAQLYLRESAYEPELELEFDTEPPGTTTDWVPPEPEEVAPEPDLTVAEGMAEQLTFLYEGEDPVQIDVDPGVIEPERVGVIRGVVKARSGVLLEGVEVRVVDHPEFGMTKTREDGEFDLAANGGGPLVLSFLREGLLDASRRVDIQYNGSVELGEVVMIPPDDQSTTFDIDEPGLHSHVSSISIDDRGVRTSVLMFRDGTEATRHSETPALLTGEITVKATEFTVGESGLETMPAPLPQSTAYTYALDFTIEEAGTDEVTFDPPVISYVDNFIGFPVGDPVPAGSWDEAAKTWVPAPDGIILKIVGEDSGEALLSLDDDSDEDGGETTALANLGIDTEERVALFETYGAGPLQVWRTEIEHFSAWDINWGLAPPDTAEAPNGAIDDGPTCSSTESGSIIECEAQGLGEVVPVVGTGLTLNWRSSRVAGGPDWEETLRLSDDTLPDGIIGIRTSAYMAGVHLQQYHAPVENLVATFVWDGADAYGRLVQGAVPVTVCAAYEYPAVYSFSSSGSLSKFGYSGNGKYNIGVSGQTASLTKCFSKPDSTIGGLDARSASDALGGWTLSNHHTYAKGSSTVYYGGGTRRQVGLGTPMIETFAGNNTSSGPYYSDDRLDVQFGSGWVSAIAVAPDGDLYIGYAGRIVKVEHDDDQVIAVAGTGTVGYSGDSGAATSAQIETPTGIDVGPDGSVYFLDAANYRIRRVGTDGVIETVAGDGTYSSGANNYAIEFAESDGTLAIGRPLSGLYTADLSDLAVGPEGDIYYFMGTESYDAIRHVLPDGRVRHLAGHRAGGWAGSTPVGWAGPGYSHSSIYFSIATGAERSLVVDGKGSIWVGQSSIARLDSTANTVSAVTNSNSGAGAIAVTPEGQVVWVDHISHQVKTIIDDAQVVLAGTLEGDGGQEYANNIVATDAQFVSPPTDLVLAPDGSIYIAYKKIVRRIAMDGPGHLLSEENIEIPSADAGEVHVFDAEGRHLSTRDAVTGVTLWTFTYDGAGLLIEMTDRDGRDTTIVRDGDAITITSPDNLETELALDGTSGLLESVLDPALNTHLFAYDEDGYLETMTDPRSGEHHYTFENHRLVSDVDPELGSKALARTQLENGFEVDVTTELELTTTYRYETEASGGVLAVRTQVAPDATETVTTIYRDGHSVTESADGTTSTMRTELDPRFGMWAPQRSHTLVELPNNSVAIHTYQRRFPDIGDVWVEQMATNSGFTDAWEHRYNTVTRLGTMTSPENREMAYELNSVGRVISFTPPGVEPITITYINGRVTEVEQGDRRRTFAYTDGLLDEVVAYLGMIGRTYNFDYDTLGRVISVVLPGMSTLGLGWDEEGRLESVTPAGQPAHTMQYDGVGNLEEYDPPAAFVGSDETTYAYDADHRLELVTRPDTKTIGIDYDDGNGRLEDVTTSDGAVLTPSYDVAGRVDGVIGPYDSELNFTYNGPVLTAEEWSGAITEGTVSRVIASDGSIASQSVNGGSTINFSYDDDDLLTAAGAVALERFAATGWIDTITVGDIVETLDYDEFGAVDGSATVYDGITSLFEYDLVRDEFGRIIEQTEVVEGGSPVVWSYEYDERGRLSRVDRGMLYVEYEYDDNGNRLSVAVMGGMPTEATYDEQDRIEVYGDIEFEHSPAGEIIAKRYDEFDAREYEFDALGNLLSVTLPDSTKVTYDYDARGRLIARYVNDVFAKGWLWQDQINPVAEVDEEGNVSARYVYGSRGHVPDYVVTGGETYRIITDYRGSVRMVVDDEGDVVETIEYGPWGEIFGQSGTALHSFGFAGGMWDRDTDLVRFGARWYDPEIGRWIMKDPIFFDGGQENLYLYVDGDPINRIDPEGLSWFEDAFTWADTHGVFDGIVGWGDTVSFGFGFLIRNVFTDDDVVNYRGGYAIGAALGIATQTCLGGGVAAAGSELSVGANLRIAPFGNRTGHPTGRYPHYHRRVFKKNGQVKDGQGMRRHRPWDKIPDYDKSPWDRF